MNRLLTLAVLVVALSVCSFAQAQERRTGARPTGNPPGGGPPGVFDPQPGVGPGAPPGVRTEAYKELIPVLVDALGDNEGDVRRYAASGLTRMGQDAVSQLADLLKNSEKSKTQRANAAYVLGKIGPSARDALPALTKAMKDSDKELRRRAAFAVACIVANDMEVAGFGRPAARFDRGGGDFGPGSGSFRGSLDVGLPDPGLLLPDKNDDTKSTSPDKEEKKPEKPPQQ